VWKRGAKGRVRRWRRGAECKVESNWATPGALDVFAFLSPYIYIYIYIVVAVSCFFSFPFVRLFSLVRDVVKRERVEFNIQASPRRIYTRYTTYIYTIYGGDERVVLAPRTTPPDLRCNKVLVFISQKFSPKWKCACVRIPSVVYLLSHNLSNKRLFGRRKSRGSLEKKFGHKRGRESI